MHNHISCDLTMSERNEAEALLRGITSFMQIVKRKNEEVSTVYVEEKSIEIIFEQCLYEYNKEVGSYFEFETYSKTGIGEPCESCYNPCQSGDEVNVNEGRRSRFKICKPCLLQRFEQSDPEDKQEWGDY